MENGEDGEKMASTFLKVGSDRSEVPLTSSLRNREKQKSVLPECCH